ncbi:hypothetical protein SRABI03_00888 [Microbacterium foliorum]|nr:hypothetical protein SRABI03_00888 [Microbacterium foliorum]
MLTRITAVSLSLLLGLGAVVHSGPTRPTSCAAALEAMGLCGSTDGSSLTISGTREHPGTGSTDPGARTAPGSPSAPGTRSGPSDEAIKFAKCMDDQGTTRCARELPTPGTPETAPQTQDTGAPAITISDLAQFAPEPTRTVAEPGNVGIAGLPTNFVVAAETVIRDGELLGMPIRVRFTPTGYDYTYGDGSTAVLESAGQTWKALGQAQFTPTPTSHTYRISGIYPASVDVRYAAEVDIGGGWQPIAGELTSRGRAQNIRILSARTALVAHTCLERPAAAGC